MFAAAGAIHVWVSLTSPEQYAGFVDSAPWAWVRDAWEQWWVPRAVPMGLLLAVSQFLIAGLLLLGGRAAIAGLALAALFAAALVVFGWWYLALGVPLIAVMGWLASRIRRRWV